MFPFLPEPGQQHEDKWKEHVDIPAFGISSKPVQGDIGKNKECAEYQEIISLY